MTSMPAMSVAFEARPAKRRDFLLIATGTVCIPLGQADQEPRSEFGGWFCACHGSKYDTSGRVRRGPAPRNLEVPPYTFKGRDLVSIG